MFTEWIIPYIKYLRLNGCQTATPYITNYSLEMIEQVFCDAFIDDFQKIPELFNTGFSCFFSRGYPSVTLLQFGKPFLRFFFLFTLCLKKHRTLVFLMSLWHSIIELTLKTLAGSTNSSSALTTPNGDCTSLDSVSLILANNILKQIKCR